MTTTAPRLLPALHLGLLTLSISLLAACGDSKQEPAKPAAAAGAQASIGAITSEAKGFNVGSEMAARRLYVFFDPQCPHCMALWQAAKPLKGQARFTWIPVGLLNQASTAQGAAILAAADPIAAMEQHEASMAARQGGITAAGGNDAQRAQVAANTALLNRFGVAAVPAIVGNHAVTGALVVKEGSMPTAALATAFGLAVPSGQ